MAKRAPSFEIVASEELYRRAIEQAGAVPYVLQYEPYKYVFIGEGVEALTGYPPDEFDPGFWGSMVVESVMQGEQAGLTVAEAAERTKSGEFTHWNCDLLIRTKGGGERWISDASIEIRAEDGTPYGSIGLMQDITDRKRVERQLALREVELELREAQRLESLSTLAGGVAHDFNNLLLAIMGHASLALSGLPRESQVYKDVEQIEVAAQRAAELTRQMLAYSGTGHMAVTELDLAASLGDVGSLIERRHPQVTLHYEIDGADLTILADQAQIGQLVLSLLENAVEALVHEVGTIELGARATGLERGELDTFELGSTLAPGRYVVLEVKDEGRGMDRRTIERAFDPFFTTKFTGRGLGLSAALGIVRSHGGAIRVTSKPGAGTTVAIALPLSQTSSG